MSRRRTLTMPFEVERGRAAVAYECEFTVTAGSPGRTYGPPEDCYPAEPPEVEAKSVYLVTKKVCPACKGQGFNAEKTTLCTKCHGRKRIEVREERPELEDLVDDDELLEHAGETEDYGPDTTAEARGER